MCPFKERLIIHTFKPFIGVVLWGWVNLPGILKRLRASVTLLFTGGENLGSNFVL